MSQSDGAVFNNNPIINEDVRADGRNIPVARDEKTVYDDASDYVFLKKRKKKHHSSSHLSARTESDSASAESSEDIFVTPGTGGRHHRYHHHRPKKRRMKRWKKVLLIIGCVLLGLVILTVSTVAILLNKGTSELYDNEVHIVQPENVPAEVQEQGKYIVYKGENYARNENVTSMLFMGVDRELTDDMVAGTAGQADAIAVIAMDFTKGKATLIEVPRDTLAEVAVYSVGGAYTGMKKTQLCLAYAYGDGKEKSCQNVLASVRNIFYNVPINTYFAIDLDGVETLNDAVGGVDVVSPETIAEFVEGESYHLEGEAAHRFVQVRDMHSTQASTLRLQRQEVYAKAYLKQVIAATKKDITTPITLFNASAPYSCTNLNPSKISVMAKELVTGKGLDFEFKRATGSISLDDTNHVVLTLDEDKFFELFLSVYYEKVPKQGETTAK